MTIRFGGKGQRNAWRRIDRKQKRSPCLKSDDESPDPRKQVSTPASMLLPATHSSSLTLPPVPPEDEGPPLEDPDDPEPRSITTLNIEAIGDEKENLPVTFGHPFVKGDVPAGDALSLVDDDGKKIPLQVDSKATYDDGSLRHAVITAVPAEASGAFSLLATASGSNDAKRPDLTVADLLDTGFDATVTFTGDANASVSAADLLSQGRIDRVFLKGGQVLEVHASSPVPGHQNLAVYFHIRLYADQRVRVDVIVENGWLQVPDPGQANYQSTIEVGNETVFGPTEMRHPHHQRWHQKYWWTEGRVADPQTKVRINRRYLISTGAVPGYMDLPPEIDDDGNNTDLDDLVKETPPLDNGPHTDYMPNAGYQSGIALLPRWCAFYVTSSGDKRAYDATLAGDDGGGAYSVHYRDEQTGEPLSIVDNPRLTLNQSNLPNPLDNENNGHTADTAHQPSIGYCGYLLSGDYYYLEELQFWATYNYLWLSDSAYGSGLNRYFHNAPVRTPEVRAQAWTLRTLGQAAYLTPDDSALKTELETYLSNVLAHYASTYARNPQANKLGVLQAKNNHANDGWLTPWQNDFATQTLGYLHLDLGFESAAPMAIYLYRSVVDRLGLEGSDQFCYKLAPSYVVIAFPPGNPDNNDHTQYYFDSWGEVYARTYGDNSDCPEGDTIDTGYPNEATAYLGSLQPAISYAVDAGYPGASKAYERLIGASNYPPRSNVTGFRNIPQWAIAPAP